MCPRRASSKNWGDAVEPVRQWTVGASVEELELELVTHQLDIAQVTSLDIPGPVDDVDLPDPFQAVLQVVQRVPFLGEVLVRAVVQRRPPRAIDRDAAVGTVTAERNG